MVKSKKIGPDLDPHRYTLWLAAVETVNGLLLVQTQTISMGIHGTMNATVPKRSTSARARGDMR